MKPPKAASAEDFTLMSSFEEVRKRLLGDEFVDRLERPLAYWALPSDRRLPYALLDRNVGEVITASYRDLSSTPGIGRKKIASLLMLLQRAVVDHSVATEPREPVVTRNANGRDSELFDPSKVSESLWEQWRATVLQHGLEHERLGRLAPSLQTLPTVIWNTPLKVYLKSGVSDIRRLKTHGDKRVRAVLEVFHTVHEMLGTLGRHRRLSVRLLPCFIAPLEQWIAGVLVHRDMPQVQDLRQNLVLPLLNQIEIDAGDVVHRLAAGRLGVEAVPESVREQSQRLGVTRARVYQLLETCGQVMAVRWPEGRLQLAVLANNFSSSPAKEEWVTLFEETRLLMFPERSTSPVREPALAESPS